MSSPEIEIAGDLQQDTDLEVYFLIRATSLSEDQIRGFLSFHEINKQAAEANVNKNSGENQ